MSRRTFLFASLAIAATPLMAQIREHLAATGEPLLVPPEASDHVLYVNKEYGNIISLDHTMDEDPELMMQAMTVGDVLRRDRGWSPGYRLRLSDWRELREDGYEPRDLLEPFDPNQWRSLEELWRDIWASEMCPATKAHRWLDEAFGAPRRSSKGVAEALDGGLEFSYGESRGEGPEVYALNAITMSVLQEELKRRGKRVTVRVV